MQFEVSSLEPGIDLVKLMGRLDMKGVNEIDNQFAFAVGTTQGSAVVDMAEVDFLASIGMRMLISTARAKANRGGKLVLLNPTALVEEALTKAGFDQLIPMFSDQDAALEALRQP